MLKITFIIPESEVNYIQRFAFEMEGQKRVIKELITDNQDNPAILDCPTFKKYHDLYQESAASFDIAKDALEVKYVPAILRQRGSSTNWILNYSSKMITITYSGNDLDQTYGSIEFAAVEDLKIEVVANDIPVNCSGCNGGK